MRYFIGIMLGVVLIAPFALAQQPRRYEYLAQATQRIIAASEATADPTPAAVETAAAAGCGALGRLLEDSAFRADLDRLSKMPRSVRERAELKRDLSLFISAFMRWEQKTLQDAGLDARSSESVLWAVVSLRTAADRDLSPDDVMGGIRSLRMELCGAAKEAQAARTGQERRRMLATWGARIGGALVIAANGAFASPSGGFALASVGIGAGVMGISFNQ
ncbi:MAG: hypothetical protein HYU37_09570 [Acidobacteria bacterium]|nr:hypothetical protein [Acidobacteriota bacterium]